MRWLGRGPLNSKVIRSKPGWWAVRTATSVGMTGAWALVWTAAVDESAANAGAAATTRAVVATATAASNERTRMETPLMELLDPSPGYDQSVLALSRDDHGAASERPLHRFGLVTAISGDAARTASRSRRSGGGDAPRDLDPGVQLGGRPALVDRAGGDLDAVGQAQRGGRVEQDDVARGAALAGQHGLGDGQVALDVAADQIGGDGRPQPQRLGVDLQLVQAVGADLQHGRGGGDGQLVQTVVPVEHQRVADPGTAQHLGHDRRHARVGHADRGMAARAG